MTLNRRTTISFPLAIVVLIVALLRLFPADPTAASRTLAANQEVFLPVVHHSTYTAPFAKRVYGVLASQPQHVASDWRAGIRARTLELGWDGYEPQEGSWNTRYIQDRQGEYRQMRDAGFMVVLDLGLQYPPAWARAIRPWQDQYGNSYDGQVNAVWSPLVRQKIERYVQRVFQDFGTDFLAVRLGSGGWVETMYPDNAPGYRFSYWAFDADAMASNPVPRWRPGQPSPNGEARTFYTWYVDRLIDTVNWQQSVVRRYYGGKLLQLFAGIGVRPAGWKTLIAYDLLPYDQIGVDAAERGVAIDRIVAGIRDRTNVVIVSSSLGDGFATAPWLDEASSDPMKWSSAHWVAYNADRYGMPKWAENTGRNSYDNMRIVFRQLDSFGYQALFWAFDEDLHSGKYASLDQYASMIVRNS